jgi:hypothetical protein
MPERVPSLWWLSAEAAPSKVAPRLLVISYGAVGANRTMGFRSPAMLDQTLDILRAFGASGTPSAVLVDREGRYCLRADRRRPGPHPGVKSGSGCVRA